MARFQLLFRSILFSCAIGSILFLAAGRLDLPFAWSVVAFWLVSNVVAAQVAGPDLMKERSKPGPGGKWDLIICSSVPLGLAFLILSGLDIGRFHWTGNIPAWIRAVGFLGLAGSFSFGIWALFVNKFFSSVIRLQSDRGHRVISEGPYRYVRHPGYATALLMLPSFVLALGSLVSAIPLAFCLYPLLERTVREDRFLKENLEGYRDYAEKVRFRLIPGVW